jgi:hypothetical protein
MNGYNSGMDVAIRTSDAVLSHEAFKRIKNCLGEFLEVDMSFKESGQMKVARILVCINVREGLVEEIELKWGPYAHTQNLDYEDVPFHCRQCHQYGHLVVDCHLLLRTNRKKSAPQAQKQRICLESVEEVPGTENGS